MSKMGMHYISLPGLYNQLEQGCPFCFVHIFQQMYTPACRPVIPPSPIVAPRPASPENEPPIQQLAWSEAVSNFLIR